MERLNKRSLEKQLVSERAELEKQLGNIELIPSMATGDSADISSHLTDENLAFAMKERISKRIKEVDVTLGRIRDKNYGKCDDCGDTIEPKRLQLVPSTRLCVACQQTAERRK